MSIKTFFFSRPYELRLSPKRDMKMRKSHLSMDDCQRHSTITTTTAHFRCHDHDAFADAIDQRRRGVDSQSATPRLRQITRHALLSVLQVGLVREGRRRVILAVDREEEEGVFERRKLVVGESMEEYGGLGGNQIYVVNDHHFPTFLTQMTPDGSVHRGFDVSGFFITKLERGVKKVGI